MKTKKTQQESEEMLDRKLGEPFMVKVSSGEDGKHCDLYNNGSIHIIRENENGIRWVDGRIDSIPTKFELECIDEKPKVKTCPICENEFELAQPFISHKGGNTCIRCYERMNHLHRESAKYRDALREELKLELKLK